MFILHFAEFLPEKSMVIYDSEIYNPCSHSHVDSLGVSEIEFCRVSNALELTLLKL